MIDNLYLALCKPMWLVAGTYKRSPLVEVGLSDT